MTMEEHNEQTTQEILNKDNYLVTEAVTTNAIPQTKISSDLEQLTKAEEKTLYKINIAKGIMNPQVEVAVSALKLSNPFKGY